MLLIYTHNIYIKETTQTDQPSSFLNIYFKFDNNGHPAIKLCDQIYDLKVNILFDSLVVI
jgi:hypothetical protein